MDLVVMCLLHVACGWTGHAFVKVVTLGKVDLPWGEGSESVITEMIGGAVLLGAAMAVALIVGRDG